MAATSHSNKLVQSTLTLSFRVMLANSTCWKQFRLKGPKALVMAIHKPKVYRQQARMLVFHSQALQGVDTPVIRPRSTCRTMLRQATAIQIVMEMVDRIISVAPSRQVLKEMETRRWKRMNDPTSAVDPYYHHREGDALRL